MTTSIPVPVAQVLPNPNQPRQTFNEEALRELAGSIAENELLQPILVEANQDGTYTLVGGERRLRAFKLLGRETIPAQVRAPTNHGGRELLIHAVIENVQRENMHPLDEAAAYQRLHDEFGMTWIEVGLKTGKNPASINHLTVLLKLEPEIQELIRAGKLSHFADLARALLRLPDAKTRLKLAQKISESNLTLKQAVSLVEKTAALLGATRIELGAAKSPAMRLAQRRSRRDFDDDQAPEGWNALKQAGQLPPWGKVTGSVTQACQACALAAMANEATCGECPLVDFLHKLTGGCHA